jgi:hypothetical protein
MKKGLLFLAAGLFLLASCSKFEEGPGFTLRSKKARLSGDWKLKEITVNGSNTYNGEPLMSDQYVLKLGIEKNGKYTMSEEYTDPANAMYNDSETGTWDWKEDSLVLKSSDGYEEPLHVVRLSNSEFWIDETDGNEKWMYKFEQE